MVVPRPVGYEYTDMSFYIIAGYHIIAALAKAQQVLSLIGKVNFMNLAYTRTILSALGFKMTTGFSDGTTIPQLQAKINYLINRMSNYALPRGLTYLDRLV